MGCHTKTIFTECLIKMAPEGNAKAIDTGCLMKNGS